MSEKGKAYASRLPAALRPDNDLYHTPMSLVWKLLEVEKLWNVLEPSEGYGAIRIPLEESGIEVDARDLMHGQNYLLNETPELWPGCIVTNPPFDLWDEFVFQAKRQKPAKIVMLGRMNYFGCKERSKSGIWENLRTVHIFNRMVDYRTPFRTDGHFHVGAMVSGWFVWEPEYQGKPEINILDVNEYATLGGFKPNVVKASHVNRKKLLG